jgi:hypothetical protein
VAPGLIQQETKRKATVWTGWDGTAVDHESGRPKCIFIGEIQAVPRVDEYIVVREGFSSETVRSVTYDFVSGEVEISVRGGDRSNEYGPCLYRTNADGEQL